MTTWILGPCLMESRKFFLDIGRQLSEIMGDRDWYLKASFDKANRTNLNSVRGLELQEGIDVFLEFKARYPHVRLLTDVHECYQVEPLSSCIDCIQIPAFLCRQTDLLVECGKHFDYINIKKGQWIAPENITGAFEKVRLFNPNAKVWLCERGTQFGYEKLIVDFGSVPIFSNVFDKVILDCTHSTQRISATGLTSGDRLMAEKYLLSASIFGYDGVFAEVHSEPEKALSDADCQIHLARINRLVDLHESISKLSVKPNQLEELDG